MRSHRSDDGLPGVYRDADGELGQTSQAVPLVELGHRELQFEPGGDGVLGGGVVVDRCTEEHQQSVAQDLVDRPAARQDSLDGHFEVAVQHPHDLFGRELLRESREAAYVGEQQRQLTRFAGELDSVGRGEELGHDVFAHVLAEDLGQVSVAFLELRRRGAAQLRRRAARERSSSPS